jgi:hypothetical protein
MKKEIHLTHKLNNRGWPVCNFPNCTRHTLKMNYKEHRLCKIHFDFMIAFQEDQNIMICEHEDCYQLFGLKFYHNKVYCREHHRQLHLLPPKVKTFGNCNYLECSHHGIVKGYNSQWCPHHYLEMCHIREHITHNQSVDDLHYRLKELQVRKDSNTATGNRHRWYYLQSYAKRIGQ